MKQAVSFTAKDYGVALALVAGWGLWYWMTLYDGPGGSLFPGDSLKWQFLWKVDGTPHSTGYPLFLLLTEMVTSLLPSWEAYRAVNLVSMVPAAISLGLVYVIALNLKIHRLLALSGVMLVGLTPVFWALATEAEVYQLHVLLNLGVLLGLIKYVEKTERKWLYLASLLLCLSFGNHLMTALMLPVFVYAVCRYDRKIFLDPASVLTIAGCIVLGLSQYVWLYFRVNQEGGFFEYVGSHPDLSRFLGYITGAQFGSYFLVENPLRALGYLLKYFLQIGIAHALIILVAVYACFKDKSREASRSMELVKVALVAQLVFLSVYGISDIQTYFLLTLVLFLMVALRYLSGMQQTIQVLVAGILVLNSLFIASQGLGKYFYRENFVMNYADHLLEQLHGVDESRVYVDRFSKSFWNYHNLMGLYYRMIADDYPIDVVNYRVEPLSMEEFPDHLPDKTLQALPDRFILVEPAKDNLALFEREFFLTPLTSRESPVDFIHRNPGAVIALAAYEYEDESKSLEKLLGQELPDTFTATYFSGELSVNMDRDHCDQIQRLGEIDRLDVKLCVGRHASGYNMGRLSIDANNRQVFTFTAGLSMIAVNPENGRVMETWSDLGDGKAISASYPAVVSYLAERRQPQKP